MTAEADCPNCGSPSTTSTSGIFPADDLLLCHSVDCRVEAFHVEGVDA